MAWIPRVAALVALTACAPAPGTPQGPAAPGSASPASAATAQAVPAEPLVLPPALAEPRQVLLIGELHGTREIPAFTGQLVTALAAQHPVVLALEIPLDLVPSLPAYLASDGGPAARAAALRDAFWRTEFQDGRRSVAIFDLIEIARRLRAGGARVTVECFDAAEPPQGTQVPPDHREATMARNVLAARAANPDATIVLLAGNLHTRKQARRPGDNWLAMRLASAGVTTLSLNARYAAGSAWFCTGSAAADCGPSPTSGPGDERGIHLEPSKDGAYDGWFGVGPASASPPAAAPLGDDQIAIRLAAARATGQHRQRANQAYEAKQYARCAEAYGQIERPSAGDAYNQACCHALAGNKDAAFDRLRYALDHGFSDLAHLAADTDLASLHGDPRWPPRKP